MELGNIMDSKILKDLIEIDFVVKTLFSEKNGEKIPSITHKVTVDATDMSFNMLMEQFKNALELAGYEFPKGSYISLVKDSGKETLDIAKGSNIIQFKKK